MDKEIIKKIYELASLAYWRDKQPCGGDFHEEACGGGHHRSACPNFKACQIETDLNNELY